MGMPRLFGFLFLLALASQANAQEFRPYYFYHALPYGTQSIYNPLNVIINGGFGILQIPCYDEYGRKIASFQYREWLENVWLTIGHPIRTLNEFGWKRFFTNEVIPTTLNLNKTQWVPNYFLHLIGAGMHSRATEEWYRYHVFSHPRLWSIGTMVIYHVLSEVVENKGNKEVTSDHLADLFIFDPLGILLFANDGVCRFFSEKLHLAEWSMQPAYNFYNGNLENMGQFYVVKYPITKDSVWNLMIHFGLHGTAGVSYRKPDGHAFSMTGGFMVENLVRAEQDIARVDSAVHPTFGVSEFQRLGDLVDNLAGLHPGQRAGLRQFTCQRRPVDKTFDQEKALFCFTGFPNPGDIRVDQLSGLLRLAQKVPESL